MTSIDRQTTHLVVHSRYSWHSQRKAHRNAVELFQEARHAVLMGKAQSLGDALSKVASVFDGPLVTTRLVSSQGAEHRHLDRRELRDVFLALANMPIDPDGIAGFAARFGLLRTEAWGNLHYEGIHHASVASWMMNAVSMRRAMQVFSSIWEDDDVSDQAGYPKDEWLDLVSYERSCRFDERDEKNTQEHPPREWLRLAVNLRNHEFTSYLLGNDLRMDCAYLTLQQVIWSQLALAISARRKFARCAYCGTFYEVEPRTKRTERLYCSTSCKLKAYRSRKKAEASKRERPSKRKSKP